MNALELATLSGFILDKRFTLLSLWQEIADNFYPERAAFTHERSLGTEFAEHLMTSFPVTTRRDLANSFGSMLRPKDKEWFEIRIRDEERETHDAKKWLEWAAGRQKRMMYDPNSLFVRATKEGDHDFATFGQCVLSIRLNKYRNGIIYRCWHLKDVAWMENDEGKIDTFVRAWKPTAKVLKDTFGEDALHKKVKTLLKSGGPKQYETINVRHLILPSEMFNGKWRNPYVSVYLDLDNKHIIEEIGVNHKEYVVPRWQTVSGSQYAYSPATICALPDARLIQAMTLVLLEASEKTANPPLIAASEMIRSGIQTFAGGVTWVDSEYDERLGEVLRPISQDYRGIPIGMDMHDRVANQLLEAFYINKIGLPPMDNKEATAYEIAQRVQDWIRQAMPLFEPMEQDYNGQVCEETFSLLMANGAFGSLDDMPDSLNGAETEFRFQSPLHDNVERLKSNRFMEIKELIIQASEVDPNIRVHVDIHRAFRDAIEGTGASASWMTSEEDAERMVGELEEQRQADAENAELAAGAETAKTAAEANKVLSQTPA